MLKWPHSVVPVVPVAQLFYRTHAAWGPRWDAAHYYLYAQLAHANALEAFWGVFAKQLRSFNSFNRIHRVHRIHQIVN